MLDEQSENSRISLMERARRVPVALAAGALVVLVVGGGFAAIWRASYGTTDEPRLSASVIAQNRMIRSNEELIEKTKALQQSQQDAIDQLQAVQDQLKAVQKVLGSQQSDTKRINSQVATLTDTLDGIRNSFAKAPPPNDAVNEPSARARPAKPRAHTVKIRRKPAVVAQRKSLQK